MKSRKQKADNEPMDNSDARIEALRTYRRPYITVDDHAVVFLRSDARAEYFIVFEVPIESDSGTYFVISINAQYASGFASFPLAVDYVVRETLKVRALLLAPVEVYTQLRSVYLKRQQ